MSRVVVVFALACLLLGACVPNKKIVYLQSENELDKEFPTDTILRTYDLANYEYRIQPEDILSIRIESLTEEEFDIFQEQGQMIAGNAGNISLTGYLVDDQGTIEFPVVGKLKVQGLTVFEAESLIQSEVSKYAASPSVRVRLLNFRVTILGEVNKEGVVDILNNRITVLEAIGRAGGLTDLAKRDKVKLIRTDVNGVQISYIDLLNEEYLSSGDLFLKNGDIIIVEPLTQRPFRKYFGPNLGLIISSISVLLLTINFLQ